MLIVPKDKDSKVPFGIDWERELDSDDSITSSSWSLTPQEEDNDLETVDGSDVSDDTSARIELKGGVPGKIYELTNEIHTSKGWIEQRTIKIAVKENLYS